MILSCQHHTQRPIFLIFRNFLLFLFLYFAPAPSHHHRSFHLIKAQHPLQFVTNPVQGAGALKICFPHLADNPRCPSLPEKLPQTWDLRVWGPHLKDTLHNIRVLGPSRNCQLSMQLFQKCSFFTPAVVTKYD